LLLSLFDQGHTSKEQYPDLNDYLRAISGEGKKAIEQKLIDKIKKKSPPIGKRYHL